MIFAKRFSSGRIPQSDLDAVQAECLLKNLLFRIPLHAATVSGTVTFPFWDC